MQDFLTQKLIKNFSPLHCLLFKRAFAKKKNMEKKTTRASLEERTASIIEAAFEVFTQEGFAAAHMEDIAKKAGVTKGLLYFYYASKQDLFLEVLEQRITGPIKKEAFFINASESMGNHLTKLLDFIYTYLIQTPQVSSLFRLLIIEGPRFPAILEYYHSHLVQPALEMIDFCMHEGVRRGEWKIESLPSYYQIFMGPLILYIIWGFTFAPYDKLDSATFCKDHKRLIFQYLGIQPLLPELAASCKKSKTPRRRPKPGNKRS